MSTKPLSESDLFDQIVLLQTAGKTAEAEKLLTNALGQFPASTVLWCARGALHYDQKQYPEAIADLNKALAFDENNEVALRWKVASWRFLRNFPEAEKAISAALERLPKSAGLWVERGWLHSDQKQYQEAIADFNQALAIDEKHEDALRWKAASWRFLRNFPEAEKAISAALERLPESAGLLVERGWLYYDQKQYQEAIAVFNQALAIDENNEDALRWKAASWRFLRNFPEAEKAISAALERLPKSAGLLVERGWLYYDQKQYPQAIAVFDKSLAVAPDNEDALAYRSRSYRAQRNFPEAEKAISAALERLPKSAGLWAERGWLHSDQKQYQKAIADFNQALVIDENNEAALRWKAASWRFLRNFPEAEKAISAALERLPNSAGLLVERGWLYYDQKQYPQAIAVFDKSLAVAPDNEDALAYRSRSYRAQRNFPEAQKAIFAALERLPKSAGLWVERGWLHYDQKQYPEAIAAFNQALAIDEKHENALIWKAATLRMQRKFTDADKFLTETLAMLPRNPDLWTERGTLYFVQKRHDEAIAAFDQALAIDPDHELALSLKSTDLRSQRKFEDAEKVISPAVERKPESVVLLNQRAQIDADCERYDAAERRFAAVCRIQPDNPDAIAGRVASLKRLSRSQEALDLLLALKASQPENNGFRSQLGWFYIGQKSLSEARKEFDFILGKDKRDSVGINGLGAVAFSEGNFDDAAERFKEVLKDDPNNAVLHTNLAWALVRGAPDTVPSMPWPDKEPKWYKFARRKPEEPRDFSLLEAKQHCRTALELDSSYSQAYGCLGIIAFKRGRFVEAEDYLRTSVRVDPQLGSYTDLGALYTQMGRYDDAKKQFERALTIDPNDSSALIELGNLQLQLDQVKEAIRTFRQCMSVDPDNETPPRALAMALMHAGDYGEAGRVLRRAIRRFEEVKRWRLHLALSQLLTNMADKSDDSELYEEALKEVNEAIALKSRHPEPYFNAGVVRFKLQDYGGAIKKFRQCLDLDPDHFDAERNLRTVQSFVKEERRRTKGSYYAGIVMAAVCMLLLIGLWVMYLRTENKVTHAMLITFSPILLGLSLIAFLLPSLLKLKLPGVEAELSQPKEKVSKGPTGSIGFGGTSSFGGTRFTDRY
jgi:tetratricopeptide (TPR) repeat protein